MSVDTLRENFHINRISIKDLQDFLTAQTYRPEITDVKHKILALNHVSLQSVCSKPIRQGKSPKYTEHTGLICIKPRNTNSMLVSAEEVDWIEPSTKEEIQNQKLEYGDVVITRSGSGTIGRASIYPYSEEAYVNDHLFIVRPSSADSHYVCSYLKSYFGERLLESGISGSTGQLNLSNEHIKAVPLFFPKPAAQKYIGEKVRQAERLRAWAVKIEKDISAFHAQFIPAQEQLNFGRKFRHVKASKMTERFDAHFYPAVVEDYFKQHETGKVLALGKLANIFNGQTQPESGDGELCDQITVTNLSSSFVVKEPRTVIAPSSNDRFTAQHDLLMCNAAHNKTYIGRDVTYYTRDKDVLPSTEVMVIRVNRELIPASYIRCYLSSKIGYVQIQSTIRGVTAHSYPVDMATLDIPIPAIPENLSKQWFATDELLLEAGKACQYATQLIALAKSLVEELIEGNVNEEELVAAQQALEAGDESLDRALLERMTAEGIDADSAPLFDDTEQLYDLLDQAKQALDADDTMAEA